ncbi:MAG: DUF1648 domain-containing protein [Terrisporobacter sp.]|uniref:DUF1648 domain-containing protein n=1 Tax=Terrisporobacter sp. TaxID=1965305 RepID=UPI002FCC7708
MKKNLNKSNLVKATYAFFATLPLLITLYLYPLIPDKIPTHYWLDGTINRWGSKSELLIIPLIILIFVYCQPIIFRLNFNDKTEDKITRWHNIYFLLISNMLVYTTLYISLNFQNCLSTFNFYNFFCCSICIFFAFIGNYIQNCSRGSSFSIKIKYTLENQVIWNRTHKFCGILWLTGSIIFLPMFLFSNGYYLMILAILMTCIFVFAPIYYIHYLHEKYIKGELSENTISKRIQHSH